MAPRSVPNGSDDGFLSAKPNGDGATTKQTALYTLAEPQKAAPGLSDFYLTYTSVGGPLELHLYERLPSEQKKVDVSVALPVSVPSSFPLQSSRPDGAKTESGEDGHGPIRLLVPVPAGAEVVAFDVQSADPGASLRILGAGLAKDVAGVDFASAMTTIRSGVTVRTKTVSRDEYSGTIAFGPLVENLAGSQAQIAITYTSSGESGAAHFSASDSAGNEHRYLLTPHAGTHTIYLYTAMGGFTPTSVSFSITAPAFRVDSLVARPYSPPHPAAVYADATVPIPADFGAMFAYDEHWWRQDDYELFSWNLFPSVVVFKFRSYETQALYLKRIAYFLEKRGYAGRLWTNAQLEGHHGWNAHDYGPGELARFYNTVSKEGFRLNPEEEELKRVLLANGILMQNGQLYEAGTGAVLAFADVGPYWLRHILLTHEGYHGIFFTHPEYRTEVFSIWDHTPSAEQALFRNVFLLYSGYDVTDSYLVENEFQAYLMEQPVAQVNSILVSQIARAAKIMGFPSDSPYYSSLKSAPAMFTKSAEAIQKAVAQTAGVEAGALVELTPE